MLLELARVLKDRRNPFTIELVFFDGEEAVARLDRHRSHLRQPPLRRGGAHGRHAEDDPRDDAGRHGRRPRPEHPPRVGLDAAGSPTSSGPPARRLGHGDVFLDEATRRRGRPRRRSSRPASRRSTSSISTTRLAHRRRHPRQRQRAQPADRRRRAARVAAADRERTAETVDRLRAPGSRARATTAQPDLQPRDADAISSRISSSVSVVADRLPRARMRSTSSSEAVSPCFSSQKITFHLPESGPTSICCSRPTSEAGTPE